MNLRLHGDTLAAAAMLDFAVNVWPGKRSPALAEALSNALEDSHYPNEAEARAALALRHGRAVEEVLLLNGACEAFWLLAHALRPARAACIHPSFTEPEAALRAVSAEVVRVFRTADNWTLDANDVPEQATFVALGNPNNPTGSLDSQDDVLALMQAGRLVVVDESFMDFADDAASLSSVPLPGIVVIRSLTKLWSLAGVRAGYLLGPADLIALLTANRQPWSVNALACAALTHCAADAETPAHVRARVNSEREHLRSGLEALGLKVWPSAANFLLVRADDGDQLRSHLIDAGIAVRPAGSFPGLDHDHLRIAVRERADNEQLLRAIRRAQTS
jgi:histidinol-phosphate/aromatic aminotransferase/cobyric acid decarboxylase-like protein